MNVNLYYVKALYTIFKLDLKYDFLSFTSQFLYAWTFLGLLSRSDKTLNTVSKNSVLSYPKCGGKNQEKDKKSLKKKYATHKYI